MATCSEKVGGSLIIYLYIWIIVSHPKACGTWEEHGDQVKGFQMKTLFYS